MCAADIVTDAQGNAIKIRDYTFIKTLGMGAFGKVVFSKSRTRAALGPSPRSLHQVKLARNERGHEVAVKILNKKKVDAMNMTRKVPLRDFIAADCRISLPRMGHALGR